MDAWGEDSRKLDGAPCAIAPKAEKASAGLQDGDTSRMPNTCPRMDKRREHQVKALLNRYERQGHVDAYPIEMAKHSENQATVLLI
uniref:Transposase n=1 Tax=Steinernema glaseri TaxID=37863 RepID=A0A1I7ZLA0_9BILA